MSYKAKSILSILDAAQLLEKSFRYGIPTNPLPETLASTVERAMRSGKNLVNWRSTMKAQHGLEKPARNDYREGFDGSFGMCFCSW